MHPSYQISSRKLHCSWDVAILPSSKVGEFLSTFASKMKNSTCEALLLYELVQTAVETLSQHIGFGQASIWIGVKSMPKIAEDPACQSYLLAASALGSLQSGDFKDGFQTAFYKDMNSSLKPCYYDERDEVIWAHLLIAFYCLLTSQNYEFKKHRGFARTLLECSTQPISYQLKQAYFLVDFSESRIAPLLYESEATLLDLCVQQISTNHENLKKMYPYICGYFLNNRRIQLDSAYRLGLQEVFVDPCIAMTTLCIMSMQYVQKILPQSILGTKCALNELKHLLTYLQYLYFPFSTDQVPLIIRGYMSQLDFFCDLVSGDLENARYSISKVLCSMDLYMLCTYQTLSPIMEHQLHFITFAATVLGAKSEQDILNFQGKLEKCNCILHRPLAYTSLLPFETNGYSAICDSPTCSMFLRSLQELSSK